MLLSMAQYTAEDLQSLERAITRLASLLERLEPLLTKFLNSTMGKRMFGSH